MRRINNQKQMSLFNPVALCCPTVGGLVLLVRVEGLLKVHSVAKRQLSGSRECPTSALPIKVHIFATTGEPTVHREELVAGVLIFRGLGAIN